MDKINEARFSQVLLDAIDRAKKYGYNPTYFIRMISADGPFETVKRIVPKSKPSDGFYKLQELGLLNLTCEAIIVESEWRRFFDEDLLQIAEKRLSDFGYKFTRFVETTPSAMGQSNALSRADAEATKSQFTPQQMTRGSENCAALPFAPASRSSAISSSRSTASAAALAAPRYPGCLRLLISLRTGAPNPTMSETDFCYVLTFMHSLTNTC